MTTGMAETCGSWIVPPEADSAWRKQILEGRLRDLWDDHVRGKCKLNRAEAGLIARWQSGDVHLVGKALDQAIQTLQNHGRWPDGDAGDSTPDAGKVRRATGKRDSGGRDAVHGPLCGKCNWPVEPACGECGPAADGETATAGDGSITAALASGGPIADALIESERRKQSQTPVAADSEREKPKPAKMPVRMVPVDQITYDGRTKPDAGRVKELMTSIQDVGLLQPVGLRKGSNVLIFGRHRFEAFRRLGWPEIPAVVISLDEDREMLARIDENLRRRQLTPLEVAEQLAAAKSIWERLHPRGRHGGSRRNKSEPASSCQDGNLKKGDQQVESFVRDRAAKTGLSKRTISRDVAIGRDLPPEVVKVVRGTPIEHNKKELATLAKLARKDPQEAVAAAKCVASGEQKTVADAVREGDHTEPPAPADEACHVLKQLLDDAARRWVKKCGKPATAQLAAGVLESVAEDWVTQDWRKSGGPVTRKKGM